MVFNGIRSIFSIGTELIFAVDPQPDITINPNKKRGFLKPFIFFNIILDLKYAVEAVHSV